MTHHHDGPVDDGSTFTIDPVHLRVTKTYQTGKESNLHIMEDHDLTIGKHAARIARSASEGSLLIAMKVDDNHDEVHYETEEYGVDGAEMLTRGIEVLTLALAAVRTMTG